MDDAAALIFHLLFVLAYGAFRLTFDVVRKGSSALGGKPVAAPARVPSERSPSMSPSEASSLTLEEEKMIELVAHNNAASGSRCEEKMVALVAHNAMKPTLLKFVSKHLSYFEDAKIVATRSTGTALESSLGLGVHRLVASGPLGGDEEVGGLVTQGRMSAVFFFADPLNPQARDACINRICCVHNVMLANNPSTGEAVLEMLKRGRHAPEELDIVSTYKGRQESFVGELPDFAAIDAAFQRQQKRHSR